MIAFNDTKGNGPVLVLIHGYCEDKSLWNGYINILSPQYRIITPDLPGFGESEILEKTSIENFADALNDLLVHLQINTCTIIGHSLGGYVALAFAESYSHKLNGFGLFHSTAFADTDDKKDSRNKTIDFIERKGVAPFSTAFVPPLFHISNRTRLENEIKVITDIATNTNQEAIIKTAIAMRDRNSRIHVLELTKLPVLFIIGKNDTAVPLEISLKQCAIPKNSIVQFLDNTGHMGMIEKQTETLNTIKAFLTICN